MINLKQFFKNKFILPISIYWAPFIIFLLCFFSFIQIKSIEQFNSKILEIEKEDIVNLHNLGAFYEIQARILNFNKNNPNSCLNYSSNNAKSLKCENLKNEYQLLILKKSVLSENGFKVELCYFPKNEYLNFIFYLVLSLVFLFVQVLILKNKFEFASNFLLENFSKVILPDSKIEILEFDQLHKKFLELEDSKRENEKIKLSGEISKQVAHDIRSPLAALSSIISEIDNLEEGSRLIIRGAIGRINDIANQLLNKSKINKDFSDINNLIVEFLAPIIDNVVTEKRMQFRDKKDIVIEANLNKSYGLFSKINALELSRLISNCINNSVEAFENGTGLITVTLIENEKHASIIIKDNGKGIPSHILDKLGEMGLTYGKDGSSSGSGLGIYHAKKTIENFGGQFLIESNVSIGTIITINLNKENVPEWFLEKLIINEDDFFVSVDDDISIHQLWKKRLEVLNLKNGHIVFTSLKDFELWEKPIGQIKYLIDYEFLNQNENGLTVIEKLNLKSNSVLVTSRYDEGDIIDKAVALNVKILPKALAGLIPIFISNQIKKVMFDIVLIDDDDLVQLTWKSIAKKMNKTFIGFKSAKNFFENIDKIDVESSLYFDCELKNEKGDIESLKAFHLGYKKIYLCTGHPVEYFSDKEVSHITKIMSKELKF